jgi:histidinol dehydrogenase
MSYYNVDPEKWDKIVQRMKDKERKHNTMDKNVEKVIMQLRDREEEGLRKYGVNTERTDLTSLEWLQHLQEELMDASVYIEKLKNEIK